MKTKLLATLCGLLATIAAPAADKPTASTDPKKPNILIIMSDDVGPFNISAYNHGMMGYKTPNIDRLAQSGAMFTDWYGQQSCTAGRAAFIMGQSPIRSGLLKVGLPAAKLTRTFFRHGGEPFEIGRDSITSVDPAYKDKGKFEFTGKIEKVTFELTKK